MKRFLIKISVVLFLGCALHIATVIFFANGKIDNFYLRFTSARQSSLILGNSRSAQGLMPSVIENELRNFSHEGSLYNYSFTLSTSPYGPYYLQSIRKKLDPKTRNGLFILSVDPWSISRESALPLDDTLKYFESSSIPFNMRFVNQNPNWEYLLKNYDRGWGDMILRNVVYQTQTNLHADGWLEVSVPMDSARQARRVRQRLEIYSKQIFEAKRAD
jgi:hypothetical protein